eukprot:CAMPEP_0178937048 /NCGR_PEP_ID=MMETSP0786-20121207/25529_1 /TAXON_ID=186022 /ORGANISM="Thalassionema frauenfeldii, Strain CCMP 1798" /LENGTH=661 /DNA_ID=CAMNT_0020615553 /DNA_START=127 /DNA_END=2112 /DNA_ORIENTATION=+
MNNAAERPSQAKHPHVYQIDFTAVASGKRIASTKRRVRWRFGFANPEALANGETGTACRGEEHDITLVWSITSGKRLVLADGQEVHYSSSRTNKLDFSWTMRGNHVLKILAHASPPLSATPGFRQYDFYVDGQSFFNFPKVFRLGLSPGAASPRGASVGMSSGGYSKYNGSKPSSKSGPASIEAPTNYDEEEAYLQEAIKNSLKDTGAPAAAASGNSHAQMSSEGKNLLMDFYADDQTQTSAPSLPPSSSYTQYNAPSQQQSYGAQPTYPPTNSYSAAPAPLALPGTAPAPVAQQPPADLWGSQQAAPAFNSTPQAAASSQYQPVTDPWGGHNATSAPPPITTNGSWGAQNVAPVPAAPAPPAPPTTSDPWGSQPVTTEAPYNPSITQSAAPETPAAVVDFSNPTPPTPASSIGFASPQANGYVSSSYQQPAPVPENNFAPAPVPENNTAPVPVAQEQQPPADPTPAPEPAADPALFTMSGLSGQVSAPSTDPNASLADQAYAKYANMAEFELVSSTKVVKENPFDAPPVGQNVSLADMKKNTKSEPKKSIMNDPTAPAPGAMVVSTSQTGNNWGQQAGLGTSQQGQQSMYGQQTAPGYGQQPLSTFGQQAQQQGYGQGAPNTQQQPPPLQQPTFGQPQQQQYPPPLQQNPYGGSFGQQQY